MKVKELIEHLEKCDPEAMVVMSKDSEGNGFSPLYENSTGRYEAESTWSGEYHDDREDLPKCVCLWPTN